MILTMLTSFIFSYNLQANFENAPTEKVVCTAGILEASEKVPHSAISSVRFSLKKDELQKSWKSKIKKIELDPRYKNHYTSYWIQPWEKTPLFAEKNILSTSDVPKNEITFQIRRFNSGEHNVAGIAVEYNIESGFYGGILIRPEYEGYSLTHISPIKLPDGILQLSLHCVLESSDE